MINHRQHLEIRQNWRPPRELAASCPRTVRLNAGGVVVRTLVLLIAAGAVATVVLLTIVAARGASRDRLIAQGLTVEARITRLWRTKEEHPSCKADYEFSAAGRNWQRSAEIRCRDWKTLSVGDSVGAQFVSDNPEMSRLAGLESSNAVPYWLAPLTSVSLAALAATLALVMRRQRRLLEEGRPAAAVITEARRQKHAHGHGHTHACYEFVTLSGRKVKGTYHGDSRALPEIGSTITVLYMRDDPRQNARYPLPFYRTP